MSWLEKAVSGVRTSMSSNQDKTVNYLMKYELKHYFSKDVPEEEREKRKSALEKKVGASFGRYGDEVGGLARKGATRTSMGLAIINDVSAYVSKVPIANVTGLGYALFAVKSVAEMPAMYRYMKKSHDWYGALKHYVMKPINYLIPVLGGAIEAGSFERMVRTRARKEARDEFIKEFGKYEAFDDRLKSKMKQSVGDSIYLPRKRQKAA